MDLQVCMEVVKKAISRKKMYVRQACMHCNLVLEVNCQQDIGCSKGEKPLTLVKFDLDEGEHKSSQVSAGTCSHIYASGYTVDESWKLAST